MEPSNLMKRPQPGEGSWGLWEGAIIGGGSWSRRLFQRWPQVLVAEINPNHVARLVRDFSFPTHRYGV